MAEAGHYENILARQLVMNRETWAALQRHGLTEQSNVRLDFTYRAPTKEAARSLEALLRDQTDYSVSVESQGMLFRKTWAVGGATRETAISPEILDEWVTWMVTAGKEAGCDFDGWGTSV